MMAHLKKKHPQTLIDDSAGNNNPRSANPITQNPTSASVALCAEDNSAETEISEPVSKRPRQMRLVAPSKVNQKTIGDALLDMIVVDFQPLQIVENEGFVNFVRKLNPDYKIPCRKSVVKLLEDRYNTHSAALKQQLRDVDNLAITSDGWSSDSNQSFLSTTAHYIKDGKLESHVIATCELTSSHNARNTADAIKTILDQWEIFDKVVSVVTDNANVMKKAVKDHLQKRNHFCVAHTLNLAVKDCLEKENIDGTEIEVNTELVALLNKCRSIVNHFKHSIKSSNKLRDMQNSLNQDTLKLKKDVATRWNSSYYMMERLKKVKVALSATLPLLDTPLENLRCDEWALLDDCIEVLGPVEKVTAILSAESYPTISSVAPIVRGLQLAITSKSMRTLPGIKLRNSLMNVVAKRLNVFEENRTAAKATFLDPRFKKKAFGVDSNAENAQKWVTEELQERLFSSGIHHAEETHNERESLLEKDTDEIWYALDSKIHETVSRQTPLSSAVTSIRQYVDLPYIKRQEDPLLWWEEKKTLFPELYKIAHKYLCIPATSVPSERLFSKAGLVCNDRRNRLKPKKLDQILFLNSTRKRKLVM